MTRSTILQHGAALVALCVLATTLACAGTVSSQSRKGFDQAGRLVSDTREDRVAVSVFRVATLTFQTESPPPKPLTPNDPGLPCRKVQETHVHHSASSRLDNIIQGVVGLIAGWFLGGGG